LTQKAPVCKIWAVRKSDRRLDAICIHQRLLQQPMALGQKFIDLCRARPSLATLRLCFKNRPNSHAWLKRFSPLIGIGGASDSV